MVEFDPGIIFDPSADLYPRGSQCAKKCAMLLGRKKLAISFIA